MIKKNLKGTFDSENSSIIQSNKVNRQHSMHRIKHESTGGLILTKNLKEIRPEIIMLHTSPLTKNKLNNIARLTIEKKKIVNHPRTPPSNASSMIEIASFNESKSKFLFML